MTTCLTARRFMLSLSVVAAISLTAVTAAPSGDKSNDHGKPATDAAKETSGTVAPSGQSDGSPKTAPPDFQSFARNQSQAQEQPVDQASSATALPMDAQSTAEAAPVASSKPISTPSSGDAEPEPIIASPAEAMKLLMEGNERWTSAKPTNPHIESARRSMVAENGQHPYATILTCSDSRLPAERIFDCGVGDIFVIRVAGNVMGVSEAGTIEYGVEHLHTPLLVIMGHTKCGAVSAAVTQAHVEGSIASLIDHIEPAVSRAAKLHPDHHDHELIPDAIVENVWQSIFDLLRTSEICRRLVKDGKLQVVGAVCDISTGEVQWFGEHPWQAELVEAMSNESTPESDVQTASGDSDH